MAASKRSLDPVGIEPDRCLNMGFTIVIYGDLLAGANIPDTVEINGLMLIV